MSLSSSAYPCPEAWIGASRVVTTSQPMWYRRSIVSLTARSLRGVGVRRVAAEEQQPLGAELREAPDVGRDPVDRRLVELVVAGHQRRAELARDRDRRGVRDRVRHVDELDVEGAELELLAVLDVV